MKQPRKPDATTYIIYSILGLAFLYVCMALGACFQLNQSETDGSIDIA